MSDAELDRLIKDWYGNLADSGQPMPTAPTEDCPPITRLWRHVTTGDGLGGGEGHIQSCDRCRRLCEIIEQEHAARGRVNVPVGRSRRFVYAFSGVAALAACLALVVVNWPGPSFDSQVNLFCQRAYLVGDPTTVRGGDERQPDGARSDLPAWLTEALTDPQVGRALEEQNKFTQRIVVHVKQGRLRVNNDGELVLGSSVEDRKTRERLTELIDRERTANVQIVDALFRQIPGASEGDRDKLRRVLTRFRAKSVFRGSD